MNDCKWASPQCLIMSILYNLTIMVIALLALVTFQLQYEYFPTQIRDITEDCS